MRTIRTLVVSAIALLLLGSCAFRGTATLWITNALPGSQLITKLYVYPSGSGYRGSSIISDPLDTGERKIQYLVEPGPTTVEAEIDYGADTAPTGTSADRESAQLQAASSCPLPRRAAPGRPLPPTPPPPRCASPARG